MFGYSHILNQLLEGVRQTARQSKARQRKARKGKTRQRKANQGKVRQGKARQRKGKQSRERQNKAHHGNMQFLIVSIILFVKNKYIIPSFFLGLQEFTCQSM